MKIATFNINGVRGRLPLLRQWLAEAAPDVLCLQELKCPGTAFPEEELREAGYRAVWKGQRAWNGVAILARDAEPVLTRDHLPGEEDGPARYIEAAVGGVLIGCVYVPNGNPRPGPKFDDKLRWLQRFEDHAAGLLKAGIPVVLAGDFNIIPTDLDVHKPERWAEDALFHPGVRQAFKRLGAAGWVDALRSRHPGEQVFTFWDYKRHAYDRNAGLRIDHLLLSPALAPTLRAAGVDAHVRGWDKPSDHASVWIALER
ncbi:exodeoxyribonuclease III [Falsirhodobacter sp. 20TX0035]|uniref:exodeoxyribonuclease III n=1 Tax=Falsirhodobacter sp. 20TX0035 TaxID=3022019 RepID=UPI00232CCDF9|nr:exodeoxyribonuclease III [Falsirhodobacter sp. 20TX0035]MDB6454285.1 exodeoxyribonuclease III [Falsirhodobacter sp. 20TX0035]